MGDGRRVVLFHLQSPLSLLPSPMTYRHLDSTLILETLERLAARIRERRPSAGLALVADDLVALGRECAAEAASLSRPYWPIRVGVGLLIAVIVAVTGLLLAR